MSCVTVDYMHCLLEVIHRKRLSELGMVYPSTTTNGHYVNQQLNSVQPPETNTRAPKERNRKGKTWKECSSRVRCNRHEDIDGCIYSLKVQGIASLLLLASFEGRNCSLLTAQWWGLLQQLNQMSWHGLRCFQASAVTVQHRLFSAMRGNRRLLMFSFYGNNRNLLITGCYSVGNTTYARLEDFIY